MKLKRFLSGFMCSLLLFGLTGCNDATNIEAIPPLSLTEVAGSRLTNLSTEEKDSIVYRYVTSRILVDKSNLIGVSEKDSKAINGLFSKVNEFLKGKSNNALLSEYGNYLLMEFSKTPYEWEQSKVEPVGFDPAARLYFVDVTYKTTKTLKQVVPDSKIVNGEPDEELLKQKRYNDYIAYLTAKNAGSLQTELLHSKFESAWGSEKAIKDSQAGVSLLERTRNITNTSGGIGKLTYSGLISEPKLNQGATMTIRYVLKYNFNLGEETDLAVESLYLNSFKLDNADTIESNYVLNDPTGIEVLKPFIDKLVNSYQKAVEESNDVGLYQLFYNYATLDKYYEDVDSYSLVSFGNYNYTVLSRSGTTVTVKVNRVANNRARGTQMSPPTYDETVIMNLVLCPDDTIRIKSVIPVSSQMVGEPLSVIRNVTGVSDIIQYSDESFTDTNKTKVEEVIKQFSKLVLNRETGSDLFYEVVDLGVSKTTVKRMMDTINSIDAERKTTWVIEFNNKSNVYCSVTLREIYETGANNFDTESVIDLVNRDGQWKVIDYIRTLNVKTGKTTIDSSGALCQDVK